MGSTCCAGAETGAAAAVVSVEDEAEVEATGEVVASPAGVVDCAWAETPRVAVNTAAAATSNPVFQIDVFVTVFINFNTAFSSNGCKCMSTVLAALRSRPENRVFLL